MRVENWPLVLDGHLRRAADLPFAWGSHDCCLWAADVVHGMTGVDYAAGFRGRYRTALGAARQIKKHGAADLAELLTGIMGNPVPVLSAKRGDLCLVETPLGPAAGICVGSRVAVPGETQLVYIGLLEALTAWRVE